jgi:Tol biopolymer transport system component
MVACLAVASCASRGPRLEPGAAPPAGAGLGSSPLEGVLTPLTFPGERHLAKVTQLTFGGRNTAVQWAENDRILFTCDEHGAPKTCAIAPDGSNLRRLAGTAAHDPGKCTSDDGVWIAYQSSEVSSQIRVRKAAGGSEREVTHDSSSSVSPVFFRGDRSRILFATTLADPLGRNADLYVVETDGTALERITFSPTFDGFPSFSPDGRRLAFSSSRHSATPPDINVFVADWIP